MPDFKIMPNNFQKKPNFQQKNARFLTKNAKLKKNRPSFKKHPNFKKVPNDHTDRSKPLISMLSKLLIFAASWDSKEEKVNLSPSLSSLSLSDNKSKNHAKHIMQNTKTLQLVLLAALARDRACYFKKIGPELRPVDAKDKPNIYIDEFGIY